MSQRAPCDRRSTLFHSDIPRWLIYSLCAAIACQSIRANAQVLSPTKPQEIGLSQARLDDLTTYLDQECESGRIAGAVAAISRHGRLGYLHATGHSNLERQTPMQEDTLFRIASMTKAITSAAVMSLIEDGKLQLKTPLSEILPEFSDLRVLQSVDGESTDTQPAPSPTIHDLLTHRSGFTYGWFGPEKLDEIYRRQQIPDFFVPTQETIGDRVQRMAKVPLKFKPGHSWDYGVSTDILGRVIERISGLTLDQFLYERFFRPLRMRDTHFQVPAEKRDRLAGLYTLNAQGQLQWVGKEPVQAAFLRFSADYCTQSPAFFSGGGGLVSTTQDYLRFLQMLLNEGKLEGTQVLSRESVRAMTANQIGEMQIPFGGHGDGFGFGFGVLTSRDLDSDIASEGTFSWGGIFNTYYWVDPQEEMIGVLMTQVFPYDHLETREKFKTLAYAALDDSGFVQTCWYQPGTEHANPHFNGRQLRVNSAEASLHPKFADRSEVRSSGLARIEIDTSLRDLRRADLYAEVWGGHPGTSRKRVSVNGRSHHLLDEVGSADEQCTHQYVHFNLKKQDLVRGYNSLQFACDQDQSFWGHFIVDNVGIRLGLEPNSPEIQEQQLGDFTAQVIVNPRADAFQLAIEVPQKYESQIESVTYQAKYFGFDENGNSYWTDWHGMTKDKVPYACLGTSTSYPYSLTWPTNLVPSQRGIQFRALVHFANSTNLQFQTRRSKRFELRHPDGVQVQLVKPVDVPKPFWSRAGRAQTCTIDLDCAPSQIEAAELHVVAWSGGAGSVKDYFTLNGHPLQIAEGSNHEVTYSRIMLDRSWLRKGKNELRLLSDTEHHGIEILRPGPVLAIRFQNKPKVSLERDAKDNSAGGLGCYKITTPNATYYLDKVGAGLSSLIDRQGNDWIGFQPSLGSGAAGEYRGFPNAVFKEAGSFFHPLNKGTDRCTTTVVSEHPDRVIISALSENELWAGTYVFTAEAATFTMTRMPAEHRFWILYEGVPGGQFDDTDWWMSSSTPTPQLMSVNQEGDLAAPEWIAFGDTQLERSLVLYHHEDDQATDRFYQMEHKMTVFGFGRDGMKKLLNSVPQSFSLMFVESRDPDEIAAEVGRLAESVTDNSVARKSTPSESVTTPTPDALESQVRKLVQYEQYALTHAGDPSAGRTLFNEKKSQCNICHQIQGQGGLVGPNLSQIGGKYDRPHLVESLLYPSRQIGYGYETTRALSWDGRIYSGILKATDEEQIVLLNKDNQTITLRREDLEQVSTSTTSLMPDGLASLFSKQEFVDLVSYLESLGPGNKFGGGVRGPITLPSGFRIATVATGLSGATAMEIAPDGRIFVCEQEGSLRVIKNGHLLPEPVLTLPVEFNWERGLIGVTVPPDFPSNPFVYLVYVSKEPYTHHRISRFRLHGDRAIPGSEEVLFRGDDQSLFGGSVPAGHQGGGIHFGPDGKLYVGLGEQTAKTPAQRMDALQGKILRLNPDGSIPDDNPFVDSTEGKYSAIWAKGCRNPFTFAFDARTGDMFINDVGGKFEEINRGFAGANYGWPIVDHGPSVQSEFADPIHVYPQSSINGGDFCPASSNWPSEFQHKYFFADFVQGWVKFIDPRAPETAQTLVSGIRRPVDLRFDPCGDLYVLLRNAWVVDDKFEGGTSSLIRIEHTGNP